MAAPEPSRTIRPSGGSGVVASMPAAASAARVRPAGMAVEALEVCGPVRNDRVELLPGRCAARDRCIEPAAPDDPVAIGVRIRVPANSGLDLVERRQPEQVDPVERDRARSKVRVGIVEGRHDGRAAGVDDLRPQVPDARAPPRRRRDRGSGRRAPRPPSKSMDVSETAPGGPDAKTRPLMTIRSASGIDREGSRTRTRCRPTWIRRGMRPIAARLDA